MDASNIIQTKEVVFRNIYTYKYTNIHEIIKNKSCISKRAVSYRGVFCGKEGKEREKYNYNLKNKKIIAFNFIHMFIILLIYKYSAC